MKKMIELTLPPFAMLWGYGNDNELQDRDVILHVRSSSVIEVFVKGNAFLSEDVITYSFTMSVPRISNPSEMMTATFVLALHSSPLLDVVADRDMIIEEIMKPAADYYRDYQMYVREQKAKVHEYVDLGLSVKWATCNVGANKPEEYGDYFAWGEINPKAEYTWENSITYGEKMSDISGNSQYDAARANWGGTWRLPTKAELEELKNQCTWKWTTQNGVKGYKVTGPNGNSIFLPATGYRIGASLYSAGKDGSYWSSTPNESDSYGVYLFFYRSKRYVVDYGRFYGQSVRPVSN